jgi:signal transduction histidine kinase
MGRGPGSATVTAMTAGSTRLRSLFGARGRAEAALPGRDAAERAARAAADERGRIARDLQDVVAHDVSVMVVQAAAARRVLERDPERAGEALRSIEDTGRAALVEMRRLLLLLRGDDEPAARTPRPGLDSIDALVEQASAAGLPTELTVEGTPRPLPPTLDLAAFRVVQEALAGALGTGRPARAAVRIAYSPEALEVEVRDTADRADREPAPGAVMRERVRVCGGTLDAGPGAHGEFAVRARLPLIEAEP